VEDEGEPKAHRGDGVLVSSSNSDGDMAGDLDGICGVKRLGDESLSSMSEEDCAIMGTVMDGLWYNRCIRILWSQGCKNGHTY
jgi:hypothetical protein